MRLSAFNRRINRISQTGGGNPDITGLAYDSRKVRKGYLFFALPGLHVDGHDFIPQAAARGAGAIIYSRPLPETVLNTAEAGAVYIRVPDSRQAMSAASAEFYGDPSKRLTTVGVTGTDGKSTTVYFIHQLLELAGYRSGYLSTVHYSTGDEVRPNPFRQSTPEAPEIHRILSEMAENGKQYAVIEATSHGLSEKTRRLSEVEFQAAVYTNISHEHLEFHGTFEQYLSDKSRLFMKLDEAAGKKPFGVVNSNDPFARRMQAATGQPVYSYALIEGPDPGGYGKADLVGRLVRTTAETVTFTASFRGGTAETELAMPGAFNAENGLAAVLTAAHLTGRDPLELAGLLKRLRPVPGRMNPVRSGQPFTVLVDYAHTPGSFARLFPMMRIQTPGRLIAVFGSAGERDREKRPAQGCIAGKYADIIVLTDEDPRGEDPIFILSEIAEGIPPDSAEKVLVIPDRTEAIRAAVRRAKPGDTVLLLGKGHESTIIYAGGPVPWNETETAVSALRDIGYSP